MNTLERYIFGKLIVSGLGATAAIFAVVWVSQAVTRIDFATGTGQSIGAFLVLLMSISPQLLAIALPFGLLIGTVQVLNGLNSNAELPVMAGAGFSRWSIAKPILLLGAAASVYTLFSAHFIEPYANREKRDIIIEARSALLTSLITAGQFRDLDRDMTIYIDNKTAGNTLNGLMLADTRDPDNQLFYYAKTAQASKLDGDDVLIMQDGQIHRRTESSGSLSIIKFDAYAISLAEFTSAAAGHAYKVVERSTAELWSPDPNDSYLQNRALEVRGEIHRRFSDWLYPFLFCLVGLSLAGHPVTSRHGEASALGLAFGAALAYRGGAYYIYGESAASTAINGMFYVLPLAGVALAGYFYHRGIHVQLPSFKVQSNIRHGLANLLGNRQLKRGAS